MILALAFLLASSAQADFTVTDTNQVLKHLDGFQAGLPFSSIQCGQSTTAQSPVPNCKVSCSDSYCTSQCDTLNASHPVTYQLTVADCSASQLSIYGNNGLSITVKSDEYTASGNTWIPAFLRSVGYFVSPDGQAQIDSLYFQEVQFVSNGKINPIQPWIVTGQLVFPNGKMGVEFELWFEPEFLGAQQILMFRMGDDILYQLQGLILGPHQ